MFRDLTRKKQQLTKEECEKILTEELRGVLAVNGDGRQAPAGKWRPLY